MNILFFIHCLIGGGAERVTVNLSEELVRRGHHVTIGLTKNIIDYPLDKRVKVDILSSPNEYKGDNVFIRKIYSFCNRIKDYIGIRKIIIDSNPDIIIASWGSKTAPILRLHGNIPIIASEHNTFDREHTPSERKKRFYINNRFNKVVVLTEYDKKFTENYLSNTVVIPNPLSFKPITHKEYDDCFSQRKNLLACGRINAFQVKGFDNLIVAFSRIASRFPEWDLDIAGDGSEDKVNQLKEIAKENGIEDRVHFLGFCQNINDVMKRHSIFILSSRSEGFGMVLTEAMAMGCTCVSYALTGPREIIQDGVDGVLVENQNIDKLSEAISRLMCDDDLRRNLSENALQRVTRFSVEKITDQWEVLFNEVINNG